jgi:hypothetical protein
MQVVLTADSVSPDRRIASSPKEREKLAFRRDFTTGRGMVAGIGDGRMNIRIPFPALNRDARLPDLWQADLGIDLFGNRF